MALYLRTLLANIRHVRIRIFTYVPSLAYGNIRCTLHGNNIAHEICSIQLSIRFHPFYFKLDQFPIQKRVSLGPEVAIPKAKALFTNCLLLDETGCNFCFFLNWIESKKSSRRVSSASKNHPGTATNLIQQILASRIT